jgi:hypothetical protein
LPSDKPLLRLYDMLENVDRIRRYTERYNFDRFCGDSKDSSVNYRFNLRDRTAFLLPLPLAGEGWGGGSRSESVPWNCPLPDPPPQAGEGTKTESIVGGRVSSAKMSPDEKSAPPRTSILLPSHQVET